MPNVFEEVLKFLSLFLFDSQGSHAAAAAAAAGRHSIWLEDIHTLTDVFRTDKKPDPANWEYKSLYRGDIAR